MRTLHAALLLALCSCIDTSTPQSDAAVTTAAVTDTSGPDPAAADALVATHSIGDHFGGGLVFYVYKKGGVQHGLIGSVKDVAEFQVWGDDITMTGEVLAARSDWNGLANSDAIVASQGQNTAAAVARNYAGGGFHDWYLPSRSEMELLYSSRFIFEQNAANGGFDQTCYFTSTEYGHVSAFGLNFMDGLIQPYTKNIEFKVRAIRSF